VQFDFPDANGKPYRASGGAMEYSEQLKCDIPKGWLVKPLGEMVDISRGSIITEKETQQGKIKVVAAGVTYSYFHSTANRPQNTITISSSGANAGYLNFWQEEIYASDCITVRGNADIDTLLIYQYLKGMQNVILGKSTGSAQPHVYPNDIAELQACEIPNYLQDRISTLMLDINKQIDINKKQTDELAALRDFLLPLLMNGQVTVAAGDAHQ
jgi:type I restriction enzyme S subunit